MLAFECSNPVFGRSTNPYSPHHVPGGSSGGEGALLALRGSPLGIGVRLFSLLLYCGHVKLKFLCQSDIGGSVRIPAHFSGCYALKPVYGRLPSSGATTPLPGVDCKRRSLGFFDFTNFDS